MVKGVELFAHRGNAHRDPGIPILRPHAVTVFPPGLRRREHNTTIFVQIHMRENENKGNLAKHRHPRTHAEYAHRTARWLFCSKTLKHVV